MRGDSTYQSYPVKIASQVNETNGFDYPLAQQDEDWVTRKKVETVTRKNLERHLQRQVVLNDGRVIEEDDPEVTNDLTEDRQTHEDEGSEDIHMSGFDRSSWTGGRGGTVLGERFQRNINTHDVRSRLSTTAAAHNIGELTHNDLDKVVKQGRGVRSVVRPYKDADSNALTIPARVIHKNKSHHRTVDKEDIHEVNRMHEGRLKTDRYVTREVVADDNHETPEEGSSTDSESYDGDAHGYSNKKEERYIDYYRVQKGRPISEGEHLRRGIHLRSQDKDAQKMDPWNQRARNTALTYHDQSDSPSDKPPKPFERKSRKTSKDRSRQLNSSERSFPTSRSSKGRSFLGNDRFHTIERSEKVGRSKKTVRGYKKYDGRHSDSDRSYRSRSMSRSSAENGYRSGGKYRSDLDSERESRLRRAFSFNSKSSGRDHSNKQPVHDSNKKSFLGSMKSLYATIKKKADSVLLEKENRQPSRPPRKHRSSSHLASNGDAKPNSVYSDNTTGRSWSGYAGSLQRKFSSKPRNTAAVSSHNISSRARSRSPENAFNSLERPARGRKVERRKTMSAFDTAMRENRDPPKFEDYKRDRSHGSRFFGQDDEIDERERPAPDMRRHLLNNVNLARRKSMNSKEAEGIKPVIRAI